MSIRGTSTETRARRGSERRRRLAHWLDTDVFTACLFLALPLSLFFVVKFYPVVYNVVLSFTNYDLFSPMKFIALDNYRAVFTEEVTLKAMRNTVYFTVGLVPIGTALALIMATLLNQPIRGRVAFRTLYYLPVVTSAVVSSMVWRWLYNPQFGLINYFLKLAGVPPQQWIYDPKLALPSLIIVSLWGGLGGNMVIFLAGLQDIPEHLYEAAKIDGARAIQMFLYITVPMLRPVTLFVVVTYCISVFRSFSIIYLLTQGGPLLTTNTLVWEIYMAAFGYLRFGKAGAISVVLLVTILLITMLNFRIMREQ